MLCAKFGWNWPSGSEEEVENRNSLQTDGRTDRWTDGRKERRTTDDKRSENLRWAKKILPQKVTMCNKKLKCVIFRNKNQCQFLKKWSNVKVKRISTNRMILSHSIFIWNIKALALTIQISLTRSKYLIRGQTPRSRSQGHKVGTHGNYLYHRILMWNNKALAPTVQKLLPTLKSNSKIKITG